MENLKPFSKSYLSAAASALAVLPDSSAVVIDGLALPAFADSLAAHADRLRVVGFIHHPLSRETGLHADVAKAFAALEARLWPRPAPGVHATAVVAASAKIDPAARIH